MQTKQLMEFDHKFVVCGKKMRNECIILFLHFMKVKPN